MKRKKTIQRAGFPGSGLPRRDFLKMAGAGAAMLALPRPAFAGIFGGGPDFEIKRRGHTHDLPALSDWGPYSKKYFGISHVPDVARGLVFDYCIFPMLTGAGGDRSLPSVTDPSGVHPWEAAPDLGYYALRFETIWKDRLYCDLSFSEWSENSRLIRMNITNHTGAPQTVTLNCLSQLVFPPLKELTAEPIRLCEVRLPEGGMWVHALDYEDLQFAKPRPTDNLVPDGKWRGEERRHDCAGGSVVAQNFGMDPGDTVVYRVRLEQPFSNAVLVWRYQMDAGPGVEFDLTGASRRQVRFEGGGAFSTVAVPLGPLAAGDCRLCFASLGGGAPALNGFALVEAGQADQVRFAARPWRPVPKIETLPRGLILKYDDVSNFYGFVLGAPMAGRRQLKWSGLDAAFGTQPGPNTRERIFGDPGRGRAGDPDSLFVHSFFQPVTVPPQSKKSVYGLICTGSEAEVRSSLAEFDASSPDLETADDTAGEEAFQPAATAQPYELSQRLMAAVTLSNVVYPYYTQRTYIRGYSPGRSWDCLYTWDSGFIGLGLLELDLQNAADILNAYLTPPGAQSAFIHHGSPVPVQIYLGWELWNRTQSRELLAYFYPRLRQYHAFLAGRLGSSTTRRHQDHLICTWDYFYNSGGWDDYAAQKYVHAHQLEASAAPVINSAQTIRCAKLLLAMAAELGRRDDFAEYAQDIAELSASLQQYSWDAPSGYFGYVMHDDEGAPTGILRDANGVNFNMGLDGIYPLVAGICSPAQEAQILGNLFSPEHLWMDIGITTIDQSAPYFNPDGYWNGSVWLAHQWFFWKTMLDLGRGDLAIRIAQTGLDLWKRVTDATYDCMEHFVPREPFGKGWNQFSSLSSPALSWFAALDTPGRLTCGFDTWIERCRFSPDKRRLDARLRPGPFLRRHFSVLACMSPGPQYRVEWNGSAAAFNCVHDGLLQIQLPPEPGKLSVR